MSVLDAPARPAPTVPGRRRGRRTGRLVLLLVGLAAALLIGSVVHLTQGTAELDPATLIGVLTGDSDTQAAAILLESRLPRWAAAVLVGATLAAAGCALQGMTRNPLAAPDTLAVNAGAYLLLTVVTLLGVPLGVLSGAGVALVGGLLAAGLTLVLAGGGTPIRLVLAGTVLALAMANITGVLILLNAQETQGLFIWGAGSLSQSGPGAVSQLAPIALAAFVVLVILGRRLDLLQLGEDEARSRGVRVGTTRLVIVVLAVLMSAIAVAVAGPIGFVGLCAPALMRLVARWIPALGQHRNLLVASALTGAVIVIGSDVALRGLLGAREAVEIPTGVLTSLLGAIFLVAFAAGMRASGVTETSVFGAAVHSRIASVKWLVVLLMTLVLVALAVVGLLLGDGMLLLGDVTNWLSGIAAPRIQFILDARLPRVLGAALAGGCLALAGLLVQNVTRNPLGDPGILGVSSGAGFGAIVALVLIPDVGFSGIVGGALLGAAATAVLVFVLAARGGVNETKIVLVGLGISAGASALTTMVVVGTDPWNRTKAITWLGGSTYGATLERVWPMLAVLVVSGVAVWLMHRELDLVQLDATTPQVLGVRTARVRRISLVLAVLLTAAATAGIGVIAFVGLVAPHAARLLIGPQHRWLPALAVVSGAALVLVADTIGRTVLAPDQLPAGLVTAVLGAPYFIYLLFRLRARR